MKTSIFGIPVVGIVDSDTGAVTFWKKGGNRRCDFCGGRLAKPVETVVEQKRYFVHLKCLNKIQ